ncbi:MAG: DUF2062 domain-containing protein [bacterium]
MKSTDYWHKKIIEPIKALLKQGLTPEKLVLSIAFGIALGLFPVIGSTTILCTAAALILHLNLPAIQLVNYLVYPLQIILLIPFYRAGEWLFQLEPLPLSATAIITMIKEDAWSAINYLWDTTLAAMVVWCLVAPILIFVLYRTLLPLVRKLSFKSNGFSK